MKFIINALLIMYTLVKLTKSSDTGNSDFRLRFMKEFYNPMIDGIDYADRIMTGVPKYPSDISTTHSFVVESLKVIRSEVRNVGDDLWSEDKAKLIGSIERAYIETMEIKQELNRLGEEVNDYYQDQLTASLQQTEETKIQNKLDVVENECYYVFTVMKWLHEKVMDEDHKWIYQ